MVDSSRVVRTRFAPSPTGYLHVGGARTALFSYLFARKHQGVFVLRIEDTDRERSTDASIEAIKDSMHWLGMDYDEGPFFQTKRFDRYDEILQLLLAQGKAYRCSCTKERLDHLREQQMAAKEKPRYDGHCRDRCVEDQDTPFVIRFKNPKEGVVTFDDMVRGPISVSNAELDDLIIARSDGTPTYNFTVIVDDADMEITHVIRGDDHINNTPRQINLLKALGITPPQYAHVPTILGSDGKRLSKRHGAVSVMQYHQDGFLPEAMLNYLVRLGWAYGDQEVFSREDMIALFSLDSVSKSAAAFSEDKLLWLNQHYIKTLPSEKYIDSLKAQFGMLGVDISNGPSLGAIIEMQKERSKTLREMAEKSIFFYRDFTEYGEKAARKNLTKDTMASLQALHTKFSEMTQWEKGLIHSTVVSVSEELELKLGKVAQPLRVAVTGDTVSPPIDETLFYMGRAVVQERLERAVAFIRNQP